MTDRITIKLPEGVEYEHPEVQRLLAEIEAVKPLPVELTVREQLAAALFRAFHKSVNGANVELSDFDPSTTSSYLAEADAAIALFLGTVSDLRTFASYDYPVSESDRVHNRIIQGFAESVERAFSK